MYERIRRPRAEIIQKGALDNCINWHLPDGPEQVSRDRAMASGSDPRYPGAKATKSKGPFQWSNKDFPTWLYGHNAISVAKNVLQEIIETPSALEVRPSL